MGNQSSINPKRRSGCRVPGLWLGLLSTLLAVASVAAQTPPSATTVPLILPAGLVYDAAGDLLFAESGRHLIRRVSPAGQLSTIAGTGTQGFGGDGGLAVAAVLDTPTALALDAAGNLFVADSHNHRIRRIDATTAVITSVATGVNPAALAIDQKGNLLFADFVTHQVRLLTLATGSISNLAGSGVQGFSGDGGPALMASLDTPIGLAVTARGDLLLADTHNHRIRRVDAVTGIITTLTTSAGLPRGLAVDAAGGLLFADAALQQILRIDPNGSVSVVAGAGTQSFAGDGGLAPAALLDSPREIALSPAGLPTLADAANGRIRQVDSVDVIHTLAGIGTTSSAVLSLAGPSVLLYGSGMVSARLAASPATGMVTLFDGELQAAPQNLGAVALVGNVASFPTAGLEVGAHRLFATYAGDTLHPSAESAALSVLVSPAPLTAALASFTILYGQPVPGLTGTLTGLLPQDAAGVSLALSSTAVALSPPGIYPVTVAVTGSAAGNYTLTTSPATVTIAKAPAAVSLDISRVPVLNVMVASTTSGLPTGSVALLDGGSPYASGTLSAGTVSFNASNLSSGSHTLTASYMGDSDFLPVLSAPVVLNLAASALPDFTLGSNGQSSATVQAGNAAQYSFSVSPLNGTLASPILLTAAGLPPGAIASFNPAYLPPGSAPATFVLTVSTPKAALSRTPLTYLFALLVPLFVFGRKRPRRAVVLLSATLMLLSASVIAGCGDRINNGPFSQTPTAYTITVTATATQSTGATVQHSATVNLTVLR